MSSIALSIPQPVIKHKGGTAIVYSYSYSHAEGKVFNKNCHTKVAVISFDPTSAVSDVGFSSNGEK